MRAWGELIGGPGKDHEFWVEKWANGLLKKTNTRYAIIEENKKILYELRNMRKENKNISSEFVCEHVLAVRAMLERYKLPGVEAGR